MTDLDDTSTSLTPARRLDVMTRESQELTAVDVHVERESQSTQTVQVLQVLHDELKAQERVEHTKPLPTIPPPRLDAGEPAASQDREAERRESTLVMPSAPPKPPPGPDPATVRRVRIVRAVLVLVWIAIVGVTIVTLRTMRVLKAPPVVATQAAKLNVAAEPAASVTPAPPAATESASAEPAPVSSDAPPVTSGDEGVIVTSQAPPGRRVWIDDHLMTEQTPEPFSVRCGKHRVRIGSTGKSQAVDVPCGGEVVLNAK